MKFVDEESGAKAIEAGNELEIDGVKLKLSFMRSKDHPDSRDGRMARTVHVSNLDFGTTTE